jgi:hypothetical protein
MLGVTLRRASKSAPAIRWKKDIASHDFDAAEAFLSIRLKPDKAKRLVRRPKHAKVSERGANGILRASGREPLAPMIPVSCATS